MYNSICCTVFKLPGKRLLSNNSSGYLIRENNSGNVHDNISESSLMACNSSHILNDLWGNFTYTGDNLQASQWIINNLLIYLNKDWKQEWGGNLELWDKEYYKLDVSVEPLFNRAVIFTITSESLHGHPVPLNTPENVSRNSIALYYFTEVNPYKDDDEPFVEFYDSKN